MNPYNQTFAIVSAILAVPWTLVSVYLFTMNTPRGTDPHARLLVYLFTGLLTFWAFFGAIVK